MYAVNHRLSNKMDTYAVTRLHNLPQELLDNILGHLEKYRDLGTMRLVWPSLEPVLLPRLFGVVRLSFLEKHRLQFLGISSSSHLAPHVRILRWHSLCHTGEGIGLSQLQAFLSSDAIPRFRPMFLEGLDSMVNLRTFTTIMLHPSQSRGALWREDVTLRSIPSNDFSKTDLVQGFDNFLVPAMLRYGSKIESLRLLCKSTYLEDTSSKPDSSTGMRHGDDLSGDPPAYYRALIEAFSSLRVRLDSFALRNVKKLDLCATFPSATSSEFQRRELQAQLFDIVSAAKELRALSLRSTDPESELEPNSRHSTIFPGLHTLDFKYLHTLKLVNLVFSMTEFNELLAKRAKTLQNILLYNCAGREAGLLEVVRFAAANPSINLQRFSVCVSQSIGLGPWGKDQTMAAQIIPEQEILDFINNGNDNGVGHAAVDPFLHRQPIGSDDWQSVSERVLPTSTDESKIDHYTDLWVTSVESPESSEWPWVN
ncbi:hypothetical protein FLAG1_00802 [Fusarium langsethiae]|uniref:F-box domain-containing protein n=1 Tax=Fusarium langsethiae TaxID=179993 RepID=A0A0N0V8N2_FUSLA|nr:hypothetical protein FLAG1_00802 [Fusarium langsethiae]GKT98026.1 unnamed protein product [Fusarium langsethiae]